MTPVIQKSPRKVHVECPRRSRETEKGQAPMVEAGGIEPPSENRRAVVTTRVFRGLISPQARSRTSSPTASHFEFRTRAQAADGVCPSPLNDAPTRCHGRAAAGR